MHIVIDISEELYKNVIERTKMGYVGSDVWIAVANGKPLPKGHGRLIDINNIESIMLEDSLDRMVYTKGNEVDWYIEAPTIIEADKEAKNEDSN